MTEADHFILEAALQVGFEYTLTDDGEMLICTEEQLVDMIKRARLQGRLDAATPLLKAAEQFRFYEQQHTDKARRMEPVFTHEQRAYDATLEKARVNGELAQEIEDFIAC